MSVFFNGIMILTTVFFLIFTGCDNGRESKNDQNSELSDDFKDSDDLFQTDSDGTFEQEGNSENEEMAENEETPDTDSETDNENSDSDIDAALCNPNPCTEKNKNVCIELYDVFYNFDLAAKCFCNDGWIGKLCNRCQKGHFGKNCKPCECKKNEVCNDGLDGDGKCSCATEIVEGKCKCYPGWSGEECELFGEKWSCTAVGEPCTDSEDCCFDGICMESLLQEGSFCMKTQLYGGEEIRRFAISPDSSLIATARMGAIRLHRADDFKEIFRVSFSPSTAIAFSPDGKFLAADEWDTLVLRSMEDGAILDSAYHSYSQMMKFSPDGTMLAVGDSDGFTVYDVTSDSLSHYFSDTPFQTGYGWNVESIDFSKDSRYLVAGSGLSSFYQNSMIYDLKEKEVLKILPVDEYYVEVAFSSSNIIATGGYPREYDDNVNVFKYIDSEWKFSHSLQGPSDEIGSLSFNASSDFLAVGGRQYSFIYPLYDRFYPILTDGWQMEFAPDDSALVIGSETGELQKYSLPSFNKYFSSRYNGSNNLKISSDESEAVFLRGNQVVFIKPLTGEVIKEATLPFDPFYYIFAFSDDLKMAVFLLDYYNDEGFALYNFTDNIVVFEKSPQYYYFEFSPDDKILAAWSGYDINDVSFYSILTGEELHKISFDDSDKVSAVKFSPDGKIAAVTHKNGNKIYDTAEWNEIFSLPFGNVSYFPDGSKIIVTNGDIKLYSSDDGSEITEPQFNINTKTAILSSDEKYIVTDSAIYEISSGETVPFETHYYGISSTGISSGNSILTTSGTNTLRVIDAKDILDKYEGDCSENSDCEPGFFCSKRVKRCFANIEYEP